MSDIVTLDGPQLAVPPDAVDELRAQVRGAVLTPEDPDRERMHLLQAVDALSPDQRAVITLRDLVGLPAVTDYLEGTLSDEDRARMDAHLAECDGCSGYLEDMRRMVGSLHETPEPPPDPDTREALLRASRDLRP